MLLLSLNKSSRLLSKNLKIKIRQMILPVVLYDCKTWYFTLRVECRQILFKNKALKQIFRPKIDENGQYRRLNNEELNVIYMLPQICWLPQSVLLLLDHDVMSSSHGVRIAFIQSIIKPYRNIFNLDAGNWTGKS